MNLGLGIKALAARKNAGHARALERFHVGAHIPLGDGAQKQGHAAICGALLLVQLLEVLRQLLGACGAHSLCSYIALAAAFLKLLASREQYVHQRALGFEPRGLLRLSRSARLHLEEALTKSIGLLENLLDALQHSGV